MISPPTSSPAKPSSKQKQEHGSVKETLESILVAFILAFIFRAFVVEAFVIPTGSMAPTLLGAHMRFRCKDCGYHFDHNYTAPQTREGDLIIGATSHQHTYNINCPNCGFKVPTVDPVEPDNDATYPSVFYGDRILVLKYLYLFEEPQRWDVVVFKSPDKEPSGDPPTYTQNYIKRLTGKPNESLMILDGDIYVGQAGEPVESYKVQTKPRYAQSALWRVIYDNDFHPHGLVRSASGETWKQPWTIRDGSGWELGQSPTDGRTFRFDNATGGSALFFDRNANEGNRAFTDWLAYDMNTPTASVQDLRVAFFYQRDAGDGPLRVMLSDGRTQFVGIITAEHAQLVRLDGDAEVPIAPPAKIPSNDGKPLRIEMTNVDYEVTLYINGREIARTTPQQYAPDIPALLTAYRRRDGWTKPFPAVEISAAQQTSQISHLSLWRDIYYGNNFATHGTPDRPIHLGPDEYFVLGDNSPLSGDARIWNTPIELQADRLSVRAGRVPGRFMLGRAFFVYWPAGFRPAQFMPALAPDFGDMRFIR